MNFFLNPSNTEIFVTNIKFFAVIVSYLTAEFIKWGISIFSFKVFIYILRVNNKNNWQYLLNYFQNLD